MPIIHNVFTKHCYLKDGEQKCKWYRVGTLKISDNGGKYLRLFHQPETTFHVMEKDVQQEEKIQGSA